MYLYIFSFVLKNNSRLCCWSHRAAVIGRQVCSITPLLCRVQVSLYSQFKTQWIRKNSLAKLHIRVKRGTRNLRAIRLLPITNAALAADSAGAGRRRSSVDISHQRLFFSETPKGRRRVQSSRKSSEQLTAAQRWLPWSLHWLETRRRYL